jgi:amphi-Trp domain-containing protein
VSYNPNIFCDMPRYISCMTEKTELEAERELSPEEAAEMLRRIADEVGSGEDITIEGNSGSITVPGTVEKIQSELEAEHEIRGEHDKVEVEVELEWIVSPETDKDNNSD